MPRTVNKSMLDDPSFVKDLAKDDITRKVIKLHDKLKKECADRSLDRDNVIEMLDIHYKMCDYYKKYGAKEMGRLLFFDVNFTEAIENIKGLHKFLDIYNPSNDCFDYTKLFSEYHKFI